MESFKPPFQNNRERFVPIPPSHHHQHHRHQPQPHRPFPHPYISPTSSPYRPSRIPYDPNFPPDARRPLPSAILDHPHDSIPADHFIAFPLPEGRADALGPPVVVWENAPTTVRRCSPLPIDWEKHGPDSPDRHQYAHHHSHRHPQRVIHQPLLETAESDHASQKRYDPKPERIEFIHDSRCCLDAPWDGRDHHHHHHHEHRRVRRRSNPPFEPFSPNSLPSSSGAVAPDDRSIEWATWKRNPFDSLEALSDAQGRPDRGSLQRSGGSRYLIAGPKPLNHSPVKKTSRIRHTIEGPRHPDHISVERVERTRHPLDGPKPPDHNFVERDARIRYPFDGPKLPECSSIERETRIRYPLDGPALDHSFIEGVRRGSYPFDAQKLLQHHIERDLADKDQMWIRRGKTIKRDKDALRIIPGKRLPLHSRLGDGKKMVSHEKKSQKTSVLLRIQPASKPIRKRKDEASVSSAHVDGFSNADMKGKAPHSLSEHVAGKGSSVELDVSFKSNALVAKPIVAPPTKTVVKSNKKVLVKKKKKKIVKRVVSIPKSKVSGKNGPGSSLSSLQKDLQHSEVLEEGTPSSQTTGNIGADAASEFPCEDLQQTEVLEEVKVPNAGCTQDAGSVPSPSKIVVLIEDSSVEGSPVAEALLEDQKCHKMDEENDMSFVYPDRGLSSFGKELVVLDSRSPSPSVVGGDLQDAVPAGNLADGHECCLGDSVAEMEERKNQMEVGVLEECRPVGSGGCKDTEELISQVDEEVGIISLEVQTSVFDHRSPSGAIDGDGSDPIFEVGLHPSDSMQSAEEVLAVTTNNANNDEIMHSLGRLSTINSPESLSMVPEVDASNAEQLLYQPSDEIRSMEDKNKLDENPSGEDNFPLKAQDPMVSEHDDNVQLDQGMHTNDHTIHQKALQFALRGTKKPTAEPKLTGKITHQSSGISNSFRHPAGFASGSLKDTATRVVRPRTWHRTDISSKSPSPVHESGLSHFPPQTFTKKVGKIPTTSYIRKGNSLVRHSAPITAFSRASPGTGTFNLSNPMSGDKMYTSLGSGRKVKSANYSKSSVGPIVSPNTPPLPHTTKLSNCIVKNPSDFPCSTTDPPQTNSETFVCETSDPIKPKESEDALWSVKGSEKQAGDLFLDGVETQSALDVEKLKSPKTRRMIYVKRKSNQLVAAPRSEIHDSSILITKKAQALPFSTSNDFYYKRKKNQLIRNNMSSESQSKQAVAIPDDNSNSEGQRAPKISSLKCSKSLSKRRFDKVLEKTCKTSKSSLVWTLSGMHSHNKDMTSLRRRKVLPYLVPWKRTTYRRCFINNTMPVSQSSLSLIRKLRLSQKRDTIYTRSTSGFSLRKSKVLSIGGSNLKWSKSIEARSKKYNEEATLAVAAVEREKREQMGAGHIVCNAENRNSPSCKSSHGERIFRVGSVRYRMDQSNRTLVRIPDEKASCSTDVKSGKHSKISFVPRRLLIGNDEYIRIGNGNQLVRDPKRLTRILASEKVRWSLHTARLRLARKRQYCQFFMRFGKCNKDGGKCPYIHDPDKVAVCTKFVKGLCIDSNCKLTHKVIPERMQDCSYFLQGLCTNESCPYRHVNVNPDASVCDGFLRGHCAGGDECRKKHSYVCPIFKANGMCPQGSTCKLHHPKNGNKSRKRKRTKKQQSARGRYFGSALLIDIGQSETVVPDDCSAEWTGDIFVFEGQYADYISLNASDEETKKTNNPMGANSTSCGGYPSDLQAADLDMLIKPIRLMNENASC